MRSVRRESLRIPFCFQFAGTYARFHERHIVCYVVWKHRDQLHTMVIYALAIVRGEARHAGYDRTKRAFPRCAFTVRSYMRHVWQGELRIAFVPRFSCSYGPSFPVGQCKIRYFLRVEFFLPHSVHASLRRDPPDVTAIFTTLRCRVNSIFVRLFIVGTRIVSIVLTVRFRSGKSGRRKRKWPDRKEVTEAVRYRHKYLDL